MPAGANPSRRSPVSSSSRLTAYRVTWPSHSAYESNAANAAYWARAGGQIARLPANASTTSDRSRGTSSQPIRQPVIEKYLEKEFTTTPLRSVSQLLDVAARNR